MKHILALAFFISAAVFLMSASIFIYYLIPIKESLFQASVAVTRDLEGFDTNSTALTFGSIPLGGSSTRAILINNSYPFPVRAKPYIEGPISELISYNSLIIRPSEASRFSFTVSSNQYTMLGDYTGNVSIRLYRL